MASNVPSTVSARPVYNRLPSGQVTSTPYVTSSVAASALPRPVYTKQPSGQVTLSSVSPGVAANVVSAGVPMSVSPPVISSVSPGVRSMPAQPAQIVSSMRMAAPTSTATVPEYVVGQDVEMYDEQRQQWIRAKVTQVQPATHPSLPPTIHMSSGWTADGQMLHKYMPATDSRLRRAAPLAPAPVVEKPVYEGVPVGDAPVVYNVGDIVEVFHAPHNKYVQCTVKRVDPAPSAGMPPTVHVESNGWLEDYTKIMQYMPATDSRLRPTRQVA